MLPPDQPQWGDSRYRGSFQFQFWQQGYWTEVTIDDCLPCINSSLCFSHCNTPNAFWVALLEKAYAKWVLVEFPYLISEFSLSCITKNKIVYFGNPNSLIAFRLHGSYERLWAGKVSEALVDLTGGLAECWSLADFGSEVEKSQEQDSDQVRRRRLNLNLLNPVKDTCALSCSTQSSPGGQFYSFGWCKGFLSCATSPVDLFAFCRGQWAGSVPCSGCHGVVGC